MRKHASIASRTFFSNMHKASSHMRKMPAPLPQSFHQTCTSTRPLPTLGQSETCETCQHRFQNVSIKHAEFRSASLPKYLSNVHKVSSHVEPKRPDHT
jgi:hypothetical protein